MILKAFQRNILQRRTTIDCSGIFQFREGIPIAGVSHHPHPHGGTPAIGLPEKTPYLL